MGQHGKPAMSHRELRIAYREACEERRRLREELARVTQDNVRMSGRLAEIDLGPDRLDLSVLPEDQETEEHPAPVGHPPLLPYMPRESPETFLGLTTAEAAKNAKTFLVKLHQSSDEPAKDQEMRIL